VGAWRRCDAEPLGAVEAEVRGGLARGDTRRELLIDPRHGEEALRALLGQRLVEYRRVCHF
jgi:hypothetical protein